MHPAATATIEAPLQRLTTGWPDVIAGSSSRGPALTMGIKPDIAAAHRNIAIALHVLERNDEALAEFSKALSLDPNDDETKANLSLIQLVLGRFAGFQHTPA